MTRVIFVVVLLLAGCGGSGGTEGECEQLVRTAAEAGPMSDSVQDLDPAIAACGTLADLEAAAEGHEDAFDGASVRDFVVNRCAMEPSLAGSAICEEVGG